MTRILGIDPGLQTTGFGIINITPEIHCFIMIIPTI